jgi:hypothetical protein
VLGPLTLCYVLNVTDRSQILAASPHEFDGYTEEALLPETHRTSSNSVAVEVR